MVAPPAGEIQAPARVLPGATGLAARIAGVPGSSYAWTVTGGSLTGGGDGEAIRFAAGAGPKVLLRCRVTNAAGEALNSSLEVPVVAPVRLTISPAAVTLTAGRSMKFGFAIEGGLTLGVAWSLGEPGAGSLDAAGNYVAPPAPGALHGADHRQGRPHRTAIAKVRVVEAPPEGLVAPAGFTPGARGLWAKLPTVAGMTYAWEIDGGTITAGADASRVTFDAGPGPELTLRCRVSNEAGDSFLATKVLKAILP